MDVLEKTTKESGIDLTFSHDFSVSEDDDLRNWMIENLTAQLVLEELPGPEQHSAVDYRSSRFVVTPLVDLLFLCLLYTSPSPRDRG